MITDKISANISLEKLRCELGKTYEDVKQKSEKSLVLNYNGTKVIISKKKKGYYVSPNIPGYAFWIFFFCYIIIFLLSSKVNFSAINWDNGPAFVGRLVGSGLCVGGILYWIFAEIYVASKKRKIREFCNSL